MAEMRPKILRTLKQIVEIWRDKEREGESRTPKYLKEKTRLLLMRVE